VVQLAGKPDVDAGTLKRCIEKDPALAAKILRVVNSSLFSPRSEVGDLNQALALLGTKPLKLLVLGFSLPDELLSRLEEDVLGRYWKHALLKAVAARQISESIFDTPGDDAFLAGLLQDLGMLVLIQELGQSYHRFVERVSAAGADLLDCETSTLGFDHVIVSAKLLESWGLPESLVRAVAFPFDVQRILQLEQPARMLIQSLHLAELLAQLLVLGRTEALDRLLAAGRIYCELQIDQLQSLAHSMERTVPSLAECLSLRLPGGIAYTEVLLSAYSRLTDASASACQDWLTREHGLDVEARDLASAAERLVGQPMFEPPAAPVGRESADVGVGPPENLHRRDPGFVARVATAVAACRQARQALSLLLVELDDLATLIFMQGMDGAERCVQRLRSAIEQAVGPAAQTLSLEDARFAVILSGVDRQPAVEQARQLVQSIRGWALEPPRGHTPLSISAGLATLTMPPRNFPAVELIEAAERCLSGVQLSGGDGVKSIDLC
jgi:HD-like signal output (HDOD) protein/GGDEF domain-containing protein